MAFGLNNPNINGIVPKVPTPSLQVPDLASEFQKVAGNLLGNLTNLEGLTPSNNVNFPDTEASESGSAYASNPFLAYAKMDGTDLRKVFGYEFVISKGGVPLYYLPLPLAPSNINISNPVATDLSLTFRGVTENHNGAPLRPITLSGTTGVINKETMMSNPQPANGVLDYMFKNTIQAGTRVLNQFDKVLSAVQGNPAKFNSYINYPTDYDNALFKSSGYYFFHNLSRFFEYYLSIKKTSAGRKYRLHFHMYKDKSYYDVSLQNYNFSKAPGTVEYGYNINLVAFKKRKDPVGGAGRREVQIGATQASTLNALASVVNALRETRKLVSDAQGVLQGIRADVNETFFEPIRELILLGSSIANLPLAVADMPASIINDGRQSILSAIGSAEGQFSESLRLVNERLKDAGLTGNDSSESAFQEAAAKKNQDNFANLTPRPFDANPLKTVFDNPAGNVAIFDPINLADLQMSQQLRDKIDAEQARVAALTAQDFKDKRDSMSKLVTSVSESFGGGNATYNRIKGLPAPPKVFKKLTVADVILLSQLNDTLMSMDKAINLLQQIQGTNNEDYFTFYQNFATQNGVNFQSSQSKFYVPFPYGASLESLAVQYLGDIERWIEIAALNGLRAPYIDEDGFDIQLISSGSGASVTIPSADDLFIGQKVQVLSDTQRPEIKKIARIDILSSVEAIVSFEGEADLSKFLTRDNARIHAFMPNTVSSQNLIAIPSNTPVNLPGKIKSVPGTDDLNGLIKIAKVDFLLDSSGDFIFSSSGDIKLAIGLTNLIQAATMKLRTPQGSLVQRPDFGNPIQVGASTAEIDAPGTMSSLNKMFLADSRFSGILAGKILIKGPASKIDLFLGISNTDVNLPVTADLPI